MPKDFYSTGSVGQFYAMSGLVTTFGLLCAMVGPHVLGAIVAALGVLLAVVIRMPTR
jgi:hypothetical protein